MGMRELRKQSFANWEEDKHPRDKGKFAPKEGAPSEGEDRSEDFPRSGETEIPAPQKTAPLPLPDDSNAPAIVKDDHPPPGTPIEAKLSKEQAETYLSRPSAAYKIANPKGEDTLERFIDKDGNWTPERAQLHDAIIDGIVAGAKAQNRPKMTMMGGGSGAGKGYFLKHYGEKNGIHPDSRTIDADAIKKQLPEFNEAKARGDMSGAGMVHEESSYIGKMAMERLAQGRAHTVVDGTGNSSVDKLAGKLEKFREAGFSVEGHYVTVSVKQALEQNLSRSQKKGGDSEGRLVPPAVVKWIHASVSRTLGSAIERGIFDRVQVWDTSNHDAPPTKIASGAGNKLTVHDEAEWGAFVKKGKKGIVEKVSGAVKGAVKKVRGK